MVLGLGFAEAKERESDGEQREGRERVRGGLLIHSEGLGRSNGREEARARAATAMVATARRRRRRFSR